MFSQDTRTPSSFLRQSALFILYIFVMIVSMSGPAAMAATLTWDGGGADSNWSTGANWVGDPASGPGYGDSLIFSGGVRTSNNNDLISGSINSITFDAMASAFSLDGSFIRIDNGAITNLASRSHSIGMWGLDLRNTIVVSNVAGGSLTFHGLRFNGATVTFDGAGATLVDNNITFGISSLGPGALLKQGTGSLRLTGNNTGIGSVTVSAGLLTLQNGNALPDTAPVTVDGGTLDIDNAETIGSLSGTGGTVNLDADLTTGNASDKTYAGVIQGSGNLTKTGAGALTLSGANTFSGTTDIQGGTLAVDGSLAGGINVGSPGTLAGTGTVAGVIVSGRLAPGNSIGTISTGNLVFNPGAVYEVEVDAAGNSDRTDVTGSVTVWETLGGATLSVLAAAGDYALATDYTIISNDGADAVTGTFSTITSNLAFLTPSVNYAGGDGNDVVLTLARNSVGFGDVATTPNEAAVAAALERMVPGATGDTRTVLTALTGLSATGARSAFNQTGGAAHAALTQTGVNRVARSFRRISRTARASSGFRGTLFRPGITAGENRFALAEGLTMTDGGPLVASVGGGVQASPDTSRGIWVTGNGSLGKGKGDDTATRYDYTIEGIRAGFDTPITDRLLAGISLGFSNTDISYDELADTAATDSVEGALYGVYNADPWCVSGVFLYGKNDYQSTRSLSFGGITRTAQADYDGSEIGGFLEVGYRLERNSFNLEPCASLELSRVSQDSFTETGAGSLNLVVASQDISSLRSSLGLRVSQQIKPRDGITVKTEASVHCAHEFLDDDNLVNARFSGSSAGSYVVRGEKPDRNSAILELGIACTIRKNLSFSVYVDAEAGSHQRAVAATAGIEYRW